MTHEAVYTGGHPLTSQYTTCSHFEYTPGLDVLKEIAGWTKSTKHAFLKVECSSYKYLSSTFGWAIGIDGFLYLNKHILLVNWWNQFSNYRLLIEATAMRIPQVCCLGEAAIFRLFILLLNNKVAWMSLAQYWFYWYNLRKCRHFAWHYTLLFPHTHWMVPQACLTCLGQLETLCHMFVL